jgi:hypothetical protein
MSSDDARAAVPSVSPERQHVLVGDGMEPIIGKSREKSDGDQEKMGKLRLRTFSTKENREAMAMLGYLADAQGLRRVYVGGRDQLLAAIEQIHSIPAHGRGLLFRHGTSIPLNMANVSLAAVVDFCLFAPKLSSFFSFFFPFLFLLLLLLLLFCLFLLSCV